VIPNVRPRRPGGVHGTRPIACLSALALVVSLLLPPLASAHPGDPDPSFAGSGVVTRQFISDSDSETPLQWVAVGPGGKIDLVGTYDHSDQRQALVLRLEEDGAFDPTFGSGGVLITPFVEQAEHSFMIQPANAGVAWPDGSLTVGGMRLAGRLLPSGQFDPGFDRQIARDEITAMAGLSDGRVLAAGGQYEPESGRERPSVERILPDGQRDSSFGTGGVAEVPVLTSRESEGRATSIATLANGEILVAGQANDPSQQLVWLACLRPDGTPDPSFGAGGVIRVPGVSFWSPIVLATGGRVLFIRDPQTSTPDAEISGPASQPLVEAFTTAGTRDPTFGEQGTAPLPGLAANLTSWAVGASVDPAGRPLIAAKAEHAPGTAGGYVARLTPNGRLDGSYGSGGIAPTAPGAGALAITSDGLGRAIVAGKAEGEAAFVERLKGDTESPPSVSGTTPTAPGKPTRHRARRLVRISVRCSPRPAHRAITRRRATHGCIIVVQRLVGGWSVLEGSLRYHRHRVGSAHTRHSQLELRLPRSAGPRSYTLLVTLRRGRHHRTGTFTIHTAGKSVALHGHMS
jgi:uncharacterized delta-60 repeat protein